MRNNIVKDTTGDFPVDEPQDAPAEEKPAKKKPAAKRKATTKKATTKKTKAE
jgi:hypothetical protein